MCHLIEMPTLTLIWPLRAHRSSSDSLDYRSFPPAVVSLLWQYSMKTVIKNSYVPGLWWSAGEPLSPGLFIVHLGRNSSHNCLICIYSAVNVISAGGFPATSVTSCYYNELLCHIIGLFWGSSVCTVGCVGVSVFARLLNSVLGEGLVKHAPNVILEKSFLSIWVDLKSKNADSWFDLECFLERYQHISQRSYIF